MSDIVIGVSVMGEDQVRQLENRLNALQRTTRDNAERMTASLKKLGMAFGVAFSVRALKNFGVSALKSAAQFESLQISFETFLGDASKATKVLAGLQKFSISTPFTPDQVNQAGRALLAFGVEVDKLEPSLKRIGDLSAGTGKDFNELAVIFGKAKVAGTLFAEDINQLTEAGIPVIQEFAKQLGVTEGEVKKLGSEGKISFSNLQQAFSDLTSEGGRFAGLTDKLSQSTEGLFSTLSGQISNAVRGFGQKLLPAAKGILRALINIFDTRPAATKLFEEVNKGNQAFAAQEKRVNELVSEYDTLKKETDLNEKEQQRLKTVINLLAEEVPSAATAFDEYGFALDINTGKVLSNLEGQRELLRIKNVEAIISLNKEIAKQNRLREELSGHIKDGTVATTEFTRTGNVLIKRGKASDQQIGENINSFKLLNSEIAENVVRLTELGVKLTETQKAQVRLVPGFEDFGKALEDGNDDTKEAIGLLTRLRNRVKDLREEQAKSQSKARILSITREVDAIQKQIKSLTSLRAAVAAFGSIDAGTKSLSDLRKEFKATADELEKNDLSGKIREVGFETSRLEGKTPEAFIKRMDDLLEINRKFQKDFRETRGLVAEGPGPVTAEDITNEEQAQREDALLQGRLDKLKAFRDQVKADMTQLKQDLAATAVAIGAEFVEGFGRAIGAGEGLAASLRGLVEDLLVQVPKFIGLALIQSALTPQAIAAFPANLALIGAGLGLIGLSGLAGGVLSRFGGQEEEPVRASDASSTRPNVSGSTGLGDFSTLAEPDDPTFNINLNAQLVVGEDELDTTIRNLQQRRNDLSGK